MHVSKDSMWRGIWKILQNFFKLNKALTKNLIETSALVLRSFCQLCRCVKRQKLKIFVYSRQTDLMDPLASNFFLQEHSLNFGRYMGTPLHCIAWSFLYTQQFVLWLQHCSITTVALPFNWSVDTHSLSFIKMSLRQWHRSNFTKFWLCIKIVSDIYIFK